MEIYILPPLPKIIKFHQKLSKNAQIIPSSTVIVVDYYYLGKQETQIHRKPEVNHTGKPKNRKRKISIQEKWKNCKHSNGKTEWDIGANAVAFDFPRRTNWSIIWPKMFINLLNEILVTGRLHTRNHSFRVL